MFGVNDGVMISFLPTDGSWCQQEFPHMTLVYCGSIPDLPDTAQNDLGKATIAIAQEMRAFRLPVVNIEVFGTDEKVDVLTLGTTPELLAARQSVEKWNASEHKDFSPHATIGPAGSASGDLPTSLLFNRIAFSWGNRNMIFPLQSFIY